MSAETNTSPLPTPQEEKLEQSLSLLWQAREAGGGALISLKQSLMSPRTIGFDELLGQGWVEVYLGHWRLTSKGEEKASQVARRRRLSERLLWDVLNVSPSLADSAACQWEHVISAEITDSICTLLGHPQQCPHGFSIPPGPCCRREESALHPIVVALDRLKAGEEGTLAYLHLKDHPELHRLMAMGMVPGAKIHLHQTFPAYVVQLEESQIALETSAARRIYVRKKSA